ncbi:MAG: conjugal transfer protein MobC [Chitinophagaceae bacterium]
MNSENEPGLKKILDFTRLASIAILLIHFYFYCYKAFEIWNFTAKISDRFLVNLSRTGLFDTFYHSKLLSLGLLVISMIGTRGKKSENISKQTILFYIVTGLLLFLLSRFSMKINEEVTVVAIIYMIITSAGFLFILTGGTILSRYIHLQLQKDIFNELNETFPQEERLLENEYSLNFQACYNFRGKKRKSFISIINIFRACILIGNPGSGKTRYFIKPAIKQSIEKGFCLMVYDWKYPDLTKGVYNHLRKNLGSYKVEPMFCVVNLDKPAFSHCCNPLHPSTLFDIADATEASRTIMLGLNRDWITKQGDFFVESPINFLTSVIWFLKKYKDGKYCTLPHAIELMQEEYQNLFAVLKSEAEIEVLINPFISAYQNDAMEQLEGQIASAKIGMARLSSPQLYWVLSKDDFTLDINNPEKPKVLCLANNPQRQQIFGAVLSLYVNRLMKLTNRTGQQKCIFFFDEFSTLTVMGIDQAIATSRSNRVGYFLGFQDFSQLKRDYGADESAVIMNIAGNVICGQATGETAKTISERIGKIVQIKESISINRTDTSVSKSAQLDYAVPPSRISNLSSGEFVGIVADNPDQKIKLKAFHADIIDDLDKIIKEENSYGNLPEVRKVTNQEVMENYLQVKMDVKKLIETEVARLKKERREASAKKNNDNNQ